MNAPTWKSWALAGSIVLTISIVAGSFLLYCNIHEPAPVEWQRAPLTEPALEEATSNEYAFIVTTRREGLDGTRIVRTLYVAHAASYREALEEVEVFAGRIEQPGVTVTNIQLTK
jgi:hypothetical protein